MKKVIVSTESTVDLSEVKDNSFIGVRWPNFSDKNKSWVVETNEGYIVLELGDTYITNSVTRKTPQILLKYLYEWNNGEIEFFTFDSHVELVQWLVTE